MDLSKTLLLSGSTEITDNAFRAVRVAGFTGVAAMQNQPVVRIEQELLRNALEKFAFDYQGCFAQGQPGSIGNTKNMRIHGHRRLAECGVEDDIGCFTSNTWQ